MKAKSTSKFELDGIPPLKEAIPLGLQHLMAMVIGSCLPAILIANASGLNHKMSALLIQAALVLQDYQLYYNYIQYLCLKVLN